MNTRCRPLSGVWNGTFGVMKMTSIMTLQYLKDIQNPWNDFNVRNISSDALEAAQKVIILFFHRQNYAMARLMVD